MKALPVLRSNIAHLLAQDRRQQKALADACGHHKSWINKFLRGSKPQLSMTDLDTIAGFFHVDVWQLFQPMKGVFVERRAGGDRRSGQERRRELIAAGRTTARVAQRREITRTADRRQAQRR